MLKAIYKQLLLSGKLKKDTNNPTRNLVQLGFGLFFCQVSPPLIEKRRLRWRFFHL